ncbi:Uncharacterized protein Adt_44749 [Abeliophyllum distichum]|uniref:Uncharacterized protein n=1 Tax=Abeliophyllum distichum TaxID=126358 RepID=A0ABD1PBQ2_9LAMI
MQQNHPQCIDHYLQDPLGQAASQLESDTEQVVGKSKRKLEEEWNRLMKKMEEFLPLLTSDVSFLKGWSIVSSASLTSFIIGLYSVSSLKLRYSLLEDWEILD